MSEQQNPPKIYRLKVTLKETEPAIWRRILVPSNVTLQRLHLILQEVLGWTNSHLYRFKVGAKEYGEPDPNNEFNELHFINSKRAKLGEVVTAKGNAFVYEYDFGDSWIHDLVVEDILEPVTDARYPICLEGERACPPLPRQFLAPLPPRDCISVVVPAFCYRVAKTLCSRAGWTLYGVAR